MGNRFEWAVALMDIQPHFHILEIGCGVGLAIEQITPHLGTGTITAIDRSKTALDKARPRNPEAQFLQQELIELPPGHQHYDVIFGFNINLFWTQPSVTQEITLLRSNLTPTGKFYLFYGPIIGQFSKIETPIRKNLPVENLIYEPLLNCYCFIINF